MIVIPLTGHVRDAQLSTCLSGDFHSANGWTFFAEACNWLHLCSGMDSGMNAPDTKGCKSRARL
ncbi:MAG: hypothetical protein CMI66_11780 [Pedosphaera sp.]|nr:hypothetical protein [Pedosphaera sp.]HBP56137.1 hypothetical protein [Verrucomicrobiales bacterium]HCZ04005.1 hypothetical protein [Verrucomicrobiales bacterium]